MRFVSIANNSINGVVVYFILEPKEVDSPTPDLEGNRNGLHGHPVHVSVAFGGQVQWQSPPRLSTFTHSVDGGLFRYFG